MHGLHRPRRVRIYHEVSRNLDLVHEVPGRVFDTELHHAVTTSCGMRVRRDSTYLSDDEAPNCLECLIEP